MRTGKIAEIRERANLWQQIGCTVVMVAFALMLLLTTAGAMVATSNIQTCIGFVNSQSCTNEQQADGEIDQSFTDASQFNSNNQGERQNGFLNLIFDRPGVIDAQE